MAERGPASSVARSVVWAPWLLAAITLGGLVLALVGGPAFAWAAWLAMLAPILVAVQRLTRLLKGPLR